MREKQMSKRLEDELQQLNRSFDDFDKWLTAKIEEMGGTPEPEPEPIDRFRSLPPVRGIHRAINLNLIKLEEWQCPQELYEEFEPTEHWLKNSNEFNFHVAVVMTCCDFPSSMSHSELQELARLRDYFGMSPNRAALIAQGTFAYFQKKKERK